MADTSSRRLLVLHALRLKGIAEPDAVAEFAGGAPVDAISKELEELESSDLVRRRRGRIGGYGLTPEGKDQCARLLAKELDDTGHRPTIEAAYATFLGFNADLLAVCTRWQLRDIDGTPSINDHADVAYDRAVHDELIALHGQVLPVLDQLEGALDRFSIHRTRLQTALDHVLAGDHDWFTKPMFPSYHSVWFELHEDLLATLGTDRVDEIEF